jgi:hypothetical protein
MIRDVDFSTHPGARCQKGTGSGSATLKITFLCAGYGRKEAVEILLNAGANVHARDDGGLIPLHNACSFGHAEVRDFSLREHSIIVTSAVSVRPGPWLELRNFYVPRKLRLFVYLPGTVLVYL